MESSSATTPTPEEQKARKAAELRGAPFLGQPQGDVGLARGGGTDDGEEGQGRRLP